MEQLKTLGSGGFIIEFSHQSTLNALIMSFLNRLVIVKLRNDSLLSRVCSNLIYFLSRDFQYHSSFLIREGVVQEHGKKAREVQERKREP